LQGMHLGCVEVAKLCQDQFPRIVQSDRDVPLPHHLPPTPPERLCESAGSALGMSSPVQPPAPSCTTKRGLECPHTSPHSLCAATGPPSSSSCPRAFCVPLASACPWPC